MNLKQLWLIFACLIMINDMVDAQTAANFLAPGHYRFQHLSASSLQEQLLFKSKSNRGSLVLKQLKLEGFKCQPKLGTPNVQLCKKALPLTNLPNKAQQGINQLEKLAKSWGDIILGSVAQSEVYANGEILTQHLVTQSLQYDQSRVEQLIYTFYHSTELTLTKIRTLDSQLGFTYNVMDLQPYLYHHMQVDMPLPKSEYILDRALVLQAQLVYLRTDA